MKTVAEVEALKQNWLRDPCWDIEDTDGFEDYREDLINFRQSIERRWAEQKHNRLQETSERIGVPGNLTLAEYYERLENRLEQLEEEIDNLKQSDIVREILSRHK